MRDWAVDEAPHVYNMPSGVRFLPHLVKGLQARFGRDLEDGLILLPTRRAIRGLGEAFVHAAQREGRGATLLPMMRPLADINPEEPPFEPGGLALTLRPAISAAQRRFELARLVQHYYGRLSDAPLSSAGALLLSDPLISLLDDADMEEAPPEKRAALYEIIETLPEHYKQAGLFYDIIQTHWPKRLEELGLMSPMARRVQVLDALTELWTTRPPEHPVIIAGSTGTLKATARLMACVSRLEKGLVVLPGLDTHMPEDVWEKVDAQHPQNALKTVMSTLNIERSQVHPWPIEDVSDHPRRRARQRLMSESLVPADKTDDWPGRIANIRRGAQTNETGPDPFVQALDGLSVIEARTDDEEAQVIATLLRECLETFEDTAALVTPDPALARRVRAALRRWDIDVDFSQGEPLEETGLGAFLSGLLELVQDPMNPVTLAFISKHEFTGLGHAPGHIGDLWMSYERQYFRGIRPTYDNLPENVAVFLGLICDPLTPLQSTDMKGVADWAQAFTQLAESFAKTDVTQGATRLWRGEAGEKAAALLSDLIEYGDALGDMPFAEFAGLVSSLMRGQAVRPRYGTHPRLQILGPLEARMLDADIIILGGLNEGIWPARTGQAPFMSRAMRQEIGLSLPERRYGLAAHDYAELATHPHVFLTRSERSDGSPTVASRWLWRLQTLVKGALGETDAQSALSTKHPYLDWARNLDLVLSRDVISAPRPAPCPPLQARWPVRDGRSHRSLSVTQVTTWIRDPYSIYARYILGLRPLEELDASFGPAQYGTAIHRALDMFSKTYREDLPANVVAILTRLFEQELIHEGFAETDMLAERPRLEKMAQRSCAWMTARQAQGWVCVDSEAEAQLHLPSIDFTLRVKTDRLEQGPQGFAIVDFKTGRPATAKVVAAGFDPQLPLTGAILEAGQFKGLEGAVDALLYVRVSVSGPDKIESDISRGRQALSAPELIERSVDGLEKLVRLYDQADTPYPSQPRVQYIHDYGDYDHLARRAEWMRLGGEDQA